MARTGRPAVYGYSRLFAMQYFISRTCDANSHRAHGSRLHICCVIDGGQEFPTRSCSQPLQNRLDRQSSTELGACPDTTLNRASGVPHRPIKTPAWARTLFVLEGPTPCYVTGFETRAHHGREGSSQSVLFGRSVMDCAHFVAAVIAAAEAAQLL